MRNSIDYSSSEIVNNKSRTRLTIIIVSTGLVLIAILSLVTILLADPKDKFESSKWVFNATIPVIASWIGTILAFHFGRENYESASKQAIALNKDTIEDINVENIMIDVKTIFYRKAESVDYDKILLNDILKEYTDAEKDRIPIFSNDFIPRLIIPRSVLAEYINQKNLSGKTDLSLKDFITDNKNKYSNETEAGFVIISKTNSVEEAFNKMSSIKSCKDVFVTDNGKESGKAIGWVTNTLINRFLTIR